MRFFSTPSVGVKNPFHEGSVGVWIGGTLGSSRIHNALEEAHIFPRTAPEQRPDDDLMVKTGEDTVKTTWELRSTLLRC